jgi:agmatinase
MDHVEEGMIAVAGAGYDIGTTSRIGPRFAPAAIREASMYYRWFQTGAMEEITTGRVLSPPVSGKIVDLGDLETNNFEPDRVEASLSQASREIARRGAKLVALGGDHLVTPSLLKGYREGLLERGSARIGYIRFSSQLDLGELDPVWKSVWRGSASRRILESPIDQRNMVWIGVHGYQRKEQVDFARSRDLRIVTLGEIRRRGIVNVTREAVDLATRDCDAVYLSIDFDVLDGGYVAQTPGYAFDGLTNVELLHAADVLNTAPVGSIDLVGLNPRVEPTAATGGRFGAWVILRLISQQTDREQESVAGKDT